MKFYGPACDKCGDKKGELWCATCEGLFCIECICADLASLINEPLEWDREPGASERANK